MEQQSLVSAKLKTVLPEVVEKHGLCKLSENGRYCINAFAQHLPDISDLTHIEQLIVSFIDEQDAAICEHYERSQSIAQHSLGAYRGLAGIVWLQLYLARYYAPYFSTIRDSQHQILHYAKQFADASLASTELSDTKPLATSYSKSTFCEGSSATYVLSSIVYDVYDLAAPTIAEKKQKMSDCQTRLVELAQSLLRAESSIGSGTSQTSSELLYGRVGFIYSCLLMNQHFQKEIVSKQSIIEPLCRAVLNDGIRGAEKYRSSSSVNVPILMWTWHEKEYLGAGHGISGILYVLSEVYSNGTEEFERYVLPAARWLRTQQLNEPFGAYPALHGDSQSSNLVQFCHGAVGPALLFAKLYTMTRQHDFLIWAEEAAADVWHRGMLTKGVGLCHGIGGNMFVFLKLFECTKNQKWLQMAYAFALVGISNPNNMHMRPDSPYSLFEGMAGFLCALVDMMCLMRTASPQAPEALRNIRHESVFPAFDLPIFRQMKYITTFYYPFFAWMDRDDEHTNSSARNLFVPMLRFLFPGIMSAPVAAALTENNSQILDFSYASGHDSSDTAEAATGAGAVAAARAALRDSDRNAIYSLGAPKSQQQEAPVSVRRLKPEELHAAPSRRKLAAGATAESTLTPETALQKNVSDEPSLSTSKFVPTPGILDKYRPLPHTTARRATRRAKVALFESPLSIYAPETQKPQSIEELYSKTLPQVRSKLRQQSLRQTGFLRPKQLSEQDFQAFKYQSHNSDAFPTGVPKSKFDPYRDTGASAAGSVLLVEEDPSLRYFAPRQWTEGFPPDAEDDLVRHALETLVASFSIETSMSPWHYIFRIRSESRQHSICLKLTLTVTQPSVNRVLTHVERMVMLKSASESEGGSSDEHIFEGELSSMDTALLEAGTTYNAFAQVYYVDVNAREKILLTSLGPQQISVVSVGSVASAAASATKKRAVS